MTATTSTNPSKPTVSVVIPAFNEAGRLPQTLRQFWQDEAELGWPIHEYLVIDDGSTDATAALVRELQTHETRLRLLSLPQNHGKGGAVKTGALAATGDLVVIMDADGATPLTQLPGLLDAYRPQSVVIGSRHVPGSRIEHPQPWTRRLISRGGNLLIRWWLLPGIKDTQCGCKLLPRDAAQSIFPLMTRAGFSFDVELLLLARRQGYRIIEHPVTWNHVTGTSVHASVESVRFLKDIWRLRREYRLPGDKLV